MEPVLIDYAYSSGPDPTPDAGGANLSRNITTKLDKIKKQYKRELLPLTQQRERLEREIEDLKSHRDLVLEETTVLNARNEELAQLTAQYVRRAEAAEAMLPSAPTPPPKQDQSLREKPSQSFDRARLQQSSQSLASHSSTTLNDDAGDVKIIRAQKQDGLDVPGPFRPPKFLKWSGKASREHLNNKEPAINVVPPESTRPKPRAKEHTFQQLSALRIGKCDHCGEKMWGSHLRCSSGLRYFIFRAKSLTGIVPQAVVLLYIRGASIIFRYLVRSTLLQAVMNLLLIWDQCV